jgi:hypothetical protein
VPVRYYRRPPPYFRGWHADAPPRWGEHWGRDWEARRAGWDRWDRRSAPRPAPLPVYQRAYRGDQYPRAPEQQHEIHAQRYPYQPREDVTRQHYAPPAPAGHPGHGEPQRQGPPQGAPPPHDNGRHGDVEPHDRGHGHGGEGREHVR